MNALVDGKGLYRSSFEHDACGTGFIVNIEGRASTDMRDRALTALRRLSHRGAVADDGLSSDGCGISISLPIGLMRRLATEAGIGLRHTFATGLAFFGRDQARSQEAKDRLQKELAIFGHEIAGWREVPLDPSVLGTRARAVLPRIEQVYVNARVGASPAQLNRDLFVARRRTELKVDRSALYIVSLSIESIVYKALLPAERLHLFYPDLAAEDCAISFALFHLRFSTNTMPEWWLVQPFRCIAHNGEINTISGNRNWALARAPLFVSDLCPELPTLSPLVSMDGSDSASFDNMFETLLVGGLSPLYAARLMMPPAWHNIDNMDIDVRAFLQYNSMRMEPWDGPAAIVFTDGRYVGCTLDRNGLRPARYVLLEEGVLLLASEVGVNDYESVSVIERGRIGPGQMIAVDTQSGEILYNHAINERLKSRHPYRRWVSRHSVHIRSQYVESEEKWQAPPLNPEYLPAYRKYFAMTREESEDVLRVLVQDAHEAVGSMGDDAPIAPISLKHRPLFDYFRQQFAQVSNPSIDPLREAIVMSLEISIGAEKQLFEESVRQAQQLLLRSPVLPEHKFEVLMSLDRELYASELFPLDFDPASQDLRSVLVALTDAVVEAVRDRDTVLVVLSDRGLAPDRLQMPALLATGAVHHRLTKEGLRCRANIVVDTGSAWDPHHFAVLFGCGASCVHPWLSYEIIRRMAAASEFHQPFSASHFEQKFRAGINKGLLKIMSKMGISVMTSYRGAQLFEAIGLAPEIIELCFVGIVSRIGGRDFNYFSGQLQQRAADAWDQSKPIEVGGALRFVHGGEYHAWNPEVVKTLHRAVESGDYGDFQEFAASVNNRPPLALRDFLKLRQSKKPIALEEVEPVSAIVSRFDSAGMSLGALSPEAHETLAEAMNRLGARSNSGEGGEDEARHGTERSSKIKQVASGRFGVTPNYLIHAEVLQIKIAQGAKPGEGGQLMGNKIDSFIARLRHSVPGISLISPPPHHDIYSIEDLAQLIFDLKQVNPEARVSVKLVSEPGVGTIAAGVVKAYADMITISGHDGGTGASPLTSIKYAGCPWELGLAETQQVLRGNNLRGRVVLQTDGGLKSGLDVVKAALLGADSFGFGTAPMIAMGCKYLRICHLNNCATGVATQHAVLRRHHFVGTVDKVVNYMSLVAEDVRHILASIGVRSLEEIIGRNELFEIDERASQEHGLDLKPLLANQNGGDEPRKSMRKSNDPADKAELNARMVHDCLPSIEAGDGGGFHYEINNTQRSIGARLSGEIARCWGNLGMEQSPLEINMTGVAGQSFGAWNAGGLHLRLEGECNDYVGKGMAGGKIVVYLPRDGRQRSGSALAEKAQVIIGNTCLYGATGGSFFASGVAGERFAVRNSGCVAVVEGAGDHCCEYMVGGAVAILGDTGLNFGAGMTGGMAFVFDPHNRFVDCYNHELIEIQRLHREPLQAYRNYLLTLLHDHVRETGSLRGKELIEDFYALSSRFWMVTPKAAELQSLLDTLLQAA